MGSLRKSRPAWAALASALVSACALSGAWLALAAEPRSTSLVSTGPAATDGVGYPSFDAISEDGTRIFFETEERLVAADTDSRYDVYERAGKQTRLLSIGPGGGNGENDSHGAVASASGEVVYFSTDESLLAIDDDGSDDVYRREGDDLELVSTGSAGNGPLPVWLSWVSADGERAYLETEEALVPADLDGAKDVYLREDGATSLATPGTPLWVELMHFTEDGSVLFVRTHAALDAGDTDGELDVYALRGGAYELLSTGPGGGNQPGGESPLVGASADGSRAFFRTEEKLLAADTDNAQDLYERAGGTTSLVSVGPNGGNGGQDVSYQGISADGARAFFITSEQLVATDFDLAADLYERTGGVTTLLTTGTDTHGVRSTQISADGSRVLVGGGSSLLPVDDDGGWADVYELAGGAVTLLTPGIEDDDAYLLMASEDLDRVFFETNSAADPADADSDALDVYEARDGELALISTGPAGGDGPEEAELQAISADGTRAVFDTEEPLVAEDTDAEADLYLSGPPSSLDPESPAPSGSLPAQLSAEDVTAPGDPPAKGGGPRCAGMPATIVGSGKRDVVRGTEKRDVIVARGGNDRILGRGGNDLICAGGGKDTVLGGGGNDVIDGEGGADQLHGGAGSDTIRGGSGRDLCRSGAGKGTVRQCERG